MNHRYDFVYLFDCKDGNPNGDPDAANAPRIDPQDMHGLVSDVCLKRKIRNFVQIMGGARNDIFVQTKQPLNPRIAAACQAAGLPDFKKADGKWDTEKAKGRSQKDIRTVQEKLCEQYFDIRAFGGVLAIGPNAGQIRGPVQLTFSRSIDPILPLDVSITRVTDTDKEEGEMGRKNLIPYGLYRCHGFISAHLARETGFNETDLDLLWQALALMFDHDRSAARGTMSPQALIVFQHQDALGNAPAHKLFERVRVELKPDLRAQGKAPRSFDDYLLEIDDASLPASVQLIRKI
jgi:CRISPR-associated protein Csd2